MFPPLIFKLTVVYDVALKLMQ